MTDICRLRIVEKAALQELVQIYEEARVTLLIYLERIENEWEEAMFARQGWIKSDISDEAQERLYTLSHWSKTLNELQFEVKELE